MKLTYKFEHSQSSSLTAFVSVIKTDLEELQHRAHYFLLYTLCRLEALQNLGGCQVIVVKFDVNF